MFLRIFPLFILFSISLFSNPQKIPYFIDFGTEEFATHFYNQKFSPEEVTTCPFNCALEMSTFFMYLKDEFQIKTVIETGTFKGNTTAFFGSVFNTVHTIEVDPIFYSESLAFLEPYSNIICHLGSSPVVLKEILPSLANERVLFYLDAHWLADWPLMNELKQISKTHKNNCIIVVDDFKVPGRSDIPYDTHDNNDYSYEYIKRNLDRVFTEYSIHYLIPRNVASRAKFVAMPKKWVLQ